MSALEIKNKDFGKKLVEAAEEAEQERLQKLVVGKVQEMLKSIREWNDRKQSIQDGITIMEARIEALKSNKFTLSSKGEIKYLDEKLNKLPDVDPIQVVQMAANIYDQYPWNRRMGY